MQNLKDVIIAVGKLLNQSFGILIGVALLVFFWGIVKFIFTSDEKAKKAGKGLMVWGLIALFVMVSVWGIIGFFQRAFNLSIINTTQNAPEPGILPSRNTFIWPGNQPEPGDAPQPGNLPYKPLNLPGAYEPYRQ